MEVGQVLHNGATVIAWNNQVILARWTNDITPYVTWKWYRKEPRTTSHGKYHVSLEDAYDDFFSRSI